MKLAKWCVLLFLCAVVLFEFSGCEREKTKLDREVDRLCKVDGGVHIYETVRLPKESFGPDGDVFPQFTGLPTNEGRLGPLYEGRFEVSVLVAGNPSLQRNRVTVVRLSDKKLLAEIVDYSRGGGDFIGPWESSSYSCTESKKTGDFYRKIFVEEGK